MSQKALSLDILWQSGVPEAYAKRTRQALTRAVISLGLADRLDINAIGPDPLIDAAIAKAGRARPGATQIPGKTQVHQMMDWLARRSRRQGGKSLTMLVVNDDYVLREDAFAYVFGCARPGVGGTVSTYRYLRDRRIVDPLAVFAATVMHELGHALGAPGAGRRRAVQESAGLHCTNVCVMRQRDDLPEWEADIGAEMKNGREFCTMCRRDVAKALSHLRRS